MRQLAMIWLAAACAHGAPDGKAIYEKRCASCHGAQGEGVADECDEPLVGRKSVESLTRYIDKWMPEDEGDKCVGADAAAVAAWMHGAFYSPAAQARINPVKIDLARLTNEQYRQSVADLVGSFVGGAPKFKGGGLKGRYFNAEKMNTRKERLVERVDGRVVFDEAQFGKVEKIKIDRFSVTWTGSLFAPDTGGYGFRLITPNGVRLFLNSADGTGRDATALIDGWVSRGDEVRTEEGRTFLLGGRSYPLELQFLCYQQKRASIRFEWKPPGGVWEPVPAARLSEGGAPPLAVVGTPFPPDDGSLGYERGTGVSREWHDAVVRAAVETANTIVPRVDRLAKVSKDGKDRPAKLRQFCGQFAERAFRRPLDKRQREVFVGKQFAKGDAEAAARRSIVLVLCSPQFLYPGLAERAGGSPDGFARASRLALTIWDSLPDEPLWKAARENKLATAQQVEAHAERMLGDQRAAHKLSGFFHHWLAMDEADRLAKDRDAYPGFDERLVADLRNSLEQFVHDVVWSDRSDYRQLLLANHLFVNQRMAKFYGLKEPGGGGFAKVELPARRRAGVLTHPYLLAAFSYSKSTSPIHRGVFLTRSVMGRFLKPPPEAIEFMDDRFDASLTMREKVTQLTSKEACMSCHVVINPLGFSLENYDAVGRWREREQGKPINPVSDYETSTGETVRLGGPRDLANHAASSADASRGFVRQLFQHTVKQAPAAYGAERLDKLHEQFTSSEFHIRNLVLRIALTDAMHEGTKTTAAR
jgi:hypothetical protein